MSCLDSKTLKKRKNCKSGIMGDVLGKECGDSENDELQLETCEDNVREAADGSSSVEEKSSNDNDEQGCEEIDSYTVIIESKVENDQKSDVPLMPAKEEKPCCCDTCKERRESAVEHLEDMRLLQTFWMELRQYIRMVYRMSMEGSEAETSNENITKMKELVHKLCVKDPHQLFQRLESQVQEFVIEAKVRQLELLHRDEQTPEVAEIFLRGLLEGYDKLCRAAKKLSPVLLLLETEHLQRFNLTWEILNKHLYQSCVYTDPLVQNNLPHYIAKLRDVIPGESDVYTELVHKYILFDDEMTLVGALWRDAETLIHEYNQEQATLKAKQRMLREDWEFFKAQRKLIQQKMWSKTTRHRDPTQLAAGYVAGIKSVIACSELCEFDERLLNLAALAGSPESPCDGSSPEEEGQITGKVANAASSAACGTVNLGAGFCLGCSSRRGCPCDECAMSHLLTCGGFISSSTEVLPNSLQSSAIYNVKGENGPEYRAEEANEQSPKQSAEVNTTPITNEGILNQIVELPNPPQQSCECHVCTAPLMSPMDLSDSYECHTCVQQAMPPPGSVNAASVNINLHSGGFHLYPHIHGTGGGGDAGSLYPHLYNIHPTLLSQLGTKHSRLGVHLQEQIPLTGIESKVHHIPPTAVPSMTDLLPPGLSLEALPTSSDSDVTSSISENSTLSSSTSTAKLKSISSTNILSTAVPTSTSPASVPSSPTTLSTPVKTNSSKGVAVQKLKPDALCKDHTVNSGSLQHGEKQIQNTTFTQTSPNKALSQQKVPASSNSVTKPQNLVKRMSSGNQQIVNGHHHPVHTSRSNMSSVRHSTTQTASTGPSHNHVNSSLPDVVRSAANSSSHRSLNGSAGKVIGHSCHKNLKNGGNVEPIKRVSCAEYGDGDVVDVEDSSSQEDTCSERSSSTTTSTQRDSRHCDCCYCEVFGHGVPSVAPVSRNYQEMRERLRLLLTKKKAKCKMNTNSLSNTPPNRTINGSTTGTQTTSNHTSSAVVETSSKPNGGSSNVTASVPPPAGPVVPSLSKQNSADSLSQPSKDPRDLEALLDFIEGNQSGRCKNLKKAAKKARQKQKKLEEKERKEQEEAERLRGLAELQNNAPEVTITVVNTPGGPADPLPDSSNLSSNIVSNSSGRNMKQGKRSETQTDVSNDLQSNNKSGPQMVTIKRVMEPNGAEPTVTITLKGATPDKDKVLFTLVNGQVCQSQEEVKESNQNVSGNVKVNNASSNGKKKKNKGASNETNQYILTTTKNKSPQNAKNTSKNLNTNQPVGKSNTGKQIIANNSLSKTVPTANQVTSSTAATHLNGTIKTLKTPPSVATVRSKIELNSGNNPRSFSLENLKLPPGITITKVDGPTAAAAAQRRAQVKAQDNPKTTSPVTPSSTTIIAAPTIMGNPARITGYGQAVNGSNVIVVDTGRMKDDLGCNNISIQEASGDSAQNSVGTGKKKKKKNKNGASNESNHSNNAGKQQHNVSNTNQTNGKQATNASGKKQNQQNLQNGTLNGPKSQLSSVQLQTKTNGSKNNNSLPPPAIIKLNGSMVTIRNSALQQAMSAGPRVTHHVNGQADMQVSGELSEKNVSAKGNKKNVSNVVNGVSGTKGKENNGSRYMNPEKGNLRNRANQEECNSVNGGGMQCSKTVPNGIRVDDSSVSVRGGSCNGTLPQRSHPLQQQIPLINQKNHPQETNLQNSNTSRTVREAMAAATEAKKKKKKKKGAGGQGHADDWNLVESVFAPKDIDLENGDIDDDERELEAFKRFCFNSVPPKRKEKVHLNIKDIVLKKKSSAIGCS